MAVVEKKVFSVLMYSRDPSLLMTRTLLLQHAGCTVTGATCAREFESHLHIQAYDLILFCQSITADECETAAHLARQYAPGARLLVMFTRIGKCMPDHADVLLDAHSGPRAFVETAQRLLDQPASGAVN